MSLSLRTIFFFNFKNSQNFKFTFERFKFSSSDVVFFVVAVFLFVYLIVFFVLDHLDVDLNSGNVVAARIDESRLGS